MITIGIDPGKSGCMCVLKDNVPYFYDWPKDDDIHLYFGELQNHLSNHCSEEPVHLAVIEKVHAMPKQGVSSMFSFGMNFGMWLAFLAVVGIPHRLVTPQTWMKGLVPKSDKLTTKESVKSVVTKMFPKADIYTPRGKYIDGRGDALLMSVYARS